MALYLKDPEVTRAARELAALERCSITEGQPCFEGRSATDSRRARGAAPSCVATLERIRRMPILDDRDHAEMLYNKDGPPK